MGRSINKIGITEINKEKKMCNCKSIEVGSYNNQITLDVPPHMQPLHNCLGELKSNQSISVDACIMEEIKGLWGIGISTTGCCCGHNKLSGYIGVAEPDIPKMKALGYEVAININDADREDSFYPKSINKV